MHRNICRAVLCRIAIPNVITINCGRAQYLYFVFCIHWFDNGSQMGCTSWFRLVYLH